MFRDSSVPPVAFRAFRLFGFSAFQLFNFCAFLSISCPFHTYSASASLIKPIGFSPASLIKPRIRSLVPPSRLVSSRPFLFSISHFYLTFSFSFIEDLWLSCVSSTHVNPFEYRCRKISLPCPNCSPTPPHHRQGLSGCKTRACGCAPKPGENHRMRITRSALSAIFSFLYFCTFPKPCCRTCGASTAFLS